GISVSTVGLGLGYNEDLMANLASSSDGNHIFVENENDLIAAFDREFGDILSIVAQEVLVQINFAPGMKPVQVIGREADIAGQKVTTTMNQLYGSQEKYVIVEVEAASGEANATSDVAKVIVTYANMMTKTGDQLSSKISVKFSEDAALVEKSINQSVMAASVLMVATKANEEAVKLRDEGKIKEAKIVLTGNRVFIDTNNKVLKSKQLEDYGVWNDLQSEKLEGVDWAGNRKQMRAQQVANYRQIGHGGSASDVEPLDDKKRLSVGHGPGGTVIIAPSSGNIIVTPTAPVQQKSR
ncbi:MAG: hypothetical protein AAF226_16745, partial [Verrucomicrobiota bacterium]